MSIRPKPLKLRVVGSIPIKTKDENGRQAKNLPAAECLSSASS